MPEWIHNRADHIRAKNPSMPEGEAWAIATQQSHAVGKSPKEYGTAEGRHEAKSKYKTPNDDKKTADPGGIGEKLEKDAGLFKALATAQDEHVRQLINEELAKKHNHSQSHPHIKQPSPNIKTAGITTPFVLALVEGFSDELQKIKIAQMIQSNIAPKATTSTQVTSSVPRNTLNAATPRYSQINPASAPGPMQQHQPVLSPPPVRG